MTRCFYQHVGKIVDQIFGQVFEEGFGSENKVLQVLPGQKNTVLQVLPDPTNTVWQVLRGRQIQFCRFYRDEKYSFAGQKLQFYSSTGKSN